MAKSVDPDEMTPYEPSHQDLHCLQRYLVWFAGMKCLKGLDTLGRFSAIFYKGDNFCTVLCLLFSTPSSILKGFYSERKEFANSFFLE